MIGRGYERNLKNALHCFGLTSSNLITAPTWVWKAVIAAMRESMSKDNPDRALIAEADEVRCLCYLVAHQADKDGRFPPQKADEMAEVMFGKVWKQAMDISTAVFEVAREIAKATQVAKGDTPPAPLLTDVYAAAYEMYRGLVPTRSAKCMMLQTGVLKRLNLLKLEQEPEHEPANAK